MTGVPVQSVSPGAYSVNVTVPVTGATSPVTVAVSVSVRPGAPMTNPADAFVAIAGWDCTIVFSPGALHGPLTELLLTSPMKTARQR